MKKLSLSLIGIILGLFSLLAQTPEQMNIWGENCFDTQNYTEAFNWWQKAAEQGDAIAQYRVGYCYENGLGVSKNYTQAQEWYRLSAEQGLAMAQYTYGNSLMKTYSPDYAQIAEWYRKSAEQGYHKAQFNL